MENAVHHGLNGEEGTVNIKVFEQDDEIIFIVNNRLNNRLQDRLLSFNLAISLLPKSVLPKAANNTKYSTKVVTKLNSPI